MQKQNAIRESKTWSSLCKCSLIWNVNDLKPNVQEHKRERVLYGEVALSWISAWQNENDGCLVVVPTRREQES